MQDIFIHTRASMQKMFVLKKVCFQGLAFLMWL